MYDKKRNRVMIIVSLLLILFSSWISAGEKPSDTPSPLIEGKKVAMVIAYSDFQDMELNVPKALLEKEGAIVTIVSSKLGIAKGMYGTKIKTDVLIDELNVANFDAVVFVGGMGVKQYWKDPKAHAIAQDAIKKGQVLAAICWAPVILANAGVLEGKQATGHTYEDAHQILKRKGADYTGKSVTVDGNIITAFGPSSANSFAKAVIEALK